MPSGDRYVASSAGRGGRATRGRPRSRRPRSGRARGAGGRGGSRARSTGSRWRPAARAASSHPRPRVGGSPDAPSASPGGSSVTRVGRLGAAGSSGTRKPVSPWALRSPAVERRFANGRTGGAACSRARSSGGIASANALKSASSYSSTARGPGPPEAGPLEADQCLEPGAAGVRLAVAEDRRLDRADPGRRCSSCCCRRRARSSRGSRTRRGGPRRAFEVGCLAVEAERRQPLDPLADAGQLDRRRRERRGELDDEHARPGGRERPAPDRGTVGEEPDGAGVSVAAVNGVWTAIVTRPRDAAHDLVDVAVGADIVVPGRVAGPLRLADERDPGRGHRRSGRVEVVDDEAHDRRRPEERVIVLARPVDVDLAPVGGPEPDRRRAPRRTARPRARRDTAPRSRRTPPGTPSGRRGSRAAGSSGRDLAGGCDPRGVRCAGGIVPPSWAVTPILVRTRTPRPRPTSRSSPPASPRRSRLAARLVAVGLTVLLGGWAAVAVAGAATAALAPPIAAAVPTPTVTASGPAGSASPAPASSPRPGASHRLRPCRRRQRRPAPRARRRPLEPPAPAPDGNGIARPRLTTTPIGTRLQAQLDRLRARLGIPGVSATIVFRDGTS